MKTLKAAAQVVGFGATIAALIYAAQANDLARQSLEASNRQWEITEERTAADLSQITSFMFATIRAPEDGSERKTAIISAQIGFLLTNRGRTRIEIVDVAMEGPAGPMNPPVCRLDDRISVLEPGQTIPLLFVAPGKGISPGRLKVTSSTGEQVTIPFEEEVSKEISKAVLNAYNDKFEELYKKCGPKNQ